MLELSRSCDLELCAFVFGFDPHCDLALRVESRDPCFMLTLGIHCSVLLELEAVSLLLVSRDGSHQSEKFVGSRVAAESEESVVEGETKLKEKKREENMEKAAMAKKQKKEI